MSSSPSAGESLPTSPGSLHRPITGACRSCTFRPRLLGQVDAAVGGKTGVNLDHGKNLVGTIPPTRIGDLRRPASRSLPEAELRAGLAEVIKYGFIAATEHPRSRCEQRRRDLRRDAATLSAIVARSVAIKADIVSQDERELGVACPSQLRTHLRPRDRAGILVPDGRNRQVFATARPSHSA